MHTSEGQNIGLKRRRHETPVKANGVLLICNEVTGNEELYIMLHCIYRHLHKYILNIVSQHDLADNFNSCKFRLEISLITVN